MPISDADLQPLLCELEQLFPDEEPRTRITARGGDDIYLDVTGTRLGLVSLARSLIVSALTPVDSIGISSRVPVREPHAQILDSPDDRCIASICRTADLPLSPRNGGDLNRQHWLRDRIALIGCALATYWSPVSAWNTRIAFDLSGASSP